MSTTKAQDSVGMLHRQEALNYLDSISDPVTRRLAHRAHFLVLKRFAENDRLPTKDFDMRFFAEVLDQFCRQHEVLKDLLDGKAVGEWWPEPEGS